MLEDLFWRVRKWRSNGVVIDSHSLLYFSVIHWAALSWSSCMVFLRRFSAAGTNGHLDFNHRCPREDSEASGCSNCFGWFRALWLSEMVAPVWRSSAVWAPDRIGRKSIEVGCRHPVPMSMALLRYLSTRWVCMLLHHVGAQYLAIA